VSAFASAVVVALIVSVLSPMILSVLTARQHRAEKREDYARQDQVAAQAAEAARLLLERQDTLAAKAAEAARVLTVRSEEVAAQAAEAARLLLDRQNDAAARAAETARILAARSDEVAAQAAEAARLLKLSNEVVAHTAAETTGKLDIIHELVNSSMTAAIQSEMEAVEREQVLIGEIIELKRAAGREPTDGTLAALTRSADSIRKLSLTLEDRHRQAALVEAQTAVAAAKGITL